jgi:hypothetical protein
MLRWPRLFPQYLCSRTQGVTNWDGGAAEFAEEVAEQVVEEEASSAVEEWESCGDVDAGRVAGETAPWTVNPTPM